MVCVMYEVHEMPRAYRISTVRHLRGLGIVLMALIKGQIQSKGKGSPRRSVNR